MLDAAHVISRFRKDLAIRRENYLERLTKRLDEREYLSLCGRVNELDDLSSILRELIRQDNATQGENDASDDSKG